MAFICKDCFEKRWPKGFFWPMSLGPCEDCRKQAACADVPPGEEPAIPSKSGR